MWIRATVSTELGYWSTTTHTRSLLQFLRAQDVGFLQCSHLHLLAPSQVSGIWSNWIFPSTPQSNSCAVYLLVLCSLFSIIGVDSIMLQLHVEISAGIPCPAFSRSVWRLWLWLPTYNVYLSCIVRLVLHSSPPSILWRNPSCLNLYRSDSALSSLRSS